MTRLLIAVVVGVVLAVGAVFSGERTRWPALTNGTPSNASLYQYGTR